ncbi:hypothetical protein QR680_012175 [Steinernema hermaphroditum]|uniref:O-acyltransferase WSD1 C-terminal domain-containing protein n=1 Tax=Steinernema hermaphroditum TaxID=289476 RepID=A0AA39I2I1_9BILA|nr:hypothetical protein QR680_012175 [Steinernema hermaphroditum]
MPYSPPSTVDVEAAQPCLVHSKQHTAKNRSLLATGPPRLRGGPSDAFLSCVICVLLKYLIGVALSALIIGIVAAVLPVVFLIRLCLLLKTTIQGKKCMWRWRNSTCHIWYPLEHPENPESLAVFIFHSTIDLIDLCTHLSEAYQKRGMEKFFQMHNHITELARQRIITLDESQTKIETFDDLHHFLNRDSPPVTTDQLPSQLTLIPNFAANQRNGSHSLCVLRHIVTEEEPFCLLRLFTAFSRPPTSRDKSTFDVDPKFTVPLERRVLFTWYLSQKIAQFIKCVFVGPLSLLFLLLRRRSPIWKYLSPEADRSTSIRRNRDSRHSDDNQMLMASPSTFPSERAFFWGQMPLHDELQRSERVLRSPSIILYLALIAGTLRKHFREQGVRHPPDISCSFPYALRERATVDHSNPCDCVLLPIYLPTGVEGCIPRIWATQRRMSNAVNGCLPMTLKAARTLMGVTFTPRMAQRIFSSFYKSCGVLVTVVKAKGEPHVQSTRLQSALLFPSLPPNVNIAFTFVHCGTETMLSISTNRACFPQPERIFQLFEEEVHNLVDQLSLRLMTFAQATVLPPMRMSPCLFTYQGGMSPSPVISEARLSVLESEAVEEGDEMMRSLECLLQEVQEELDELSSEAVEGDRAHYIDKLKDLEKRMGVFHERLRERIECSIPGSCKIGFDATRASDTIASLLETYRQPSRKCFRPL